jgi:dihydroflavonol-4-reductase
MKVLITGGTGFIGSHLVERLRAHDAEIFALVRNPSRIRFLEGTDVHLLKGDLLNIPELPSGLDAVFHLAGMTKALKSEDYYNVNQRGSASLFDALAKRGLSPKVIYLSSLAAGGPSWEGRDRKENDSPEPVTPYGKSKLLGEAEALARKDRFPLTILRVGAVYGPRDADFLNYFKYVRRGLLPSLGLKKKLFSLCYVKDLARALEMAAGADLASGEILNIADSIPRSFEDIGQAAAEALGTTPRRIIVPMLAVFGTALVSEFSSRLRRRPTAVNRNKYRDYRQQSWVADVQKSRERLAFVTEYTLDDGVYETIRWYRDNGWL